MPEHEERFAKIESHLAELEHLYDQLNSIVTEQSEVLRKMKVQQQRVSAALENIEIERIKATHSKPPHYQ